MVEVTTSVEIAVQPSANDTVLAPGARQRERRQRILAIREEIESGEYRIAACDLAAAILRSARRAN